MFLSASDVCQILFFTFISPSLAISLSLYLYLSLMGEYLTTGLFMSVSIASVIFINKPLNLVLFHKYSLFFFCLFFFFFFFFFNFVLFNAAKTDTKLTLHHMGKFLSFNLSR